MNTRTIDGDLRNAYDNMTKHRHDKTISAQRYEQCAHYKP